MIRKSVQANCSCHTSLFCSWSWVLLYPHWQSFLGVRQPIISYGWSFPIVILQGWHHPLISTANPDKDSREHHHPQILLKGDALASLSWARAEPIRSSHGWITLRSPDPIAVQMEFHSVSRYRDLMGDVALRCPQLDHLLCLYSVVSLSIVCFWGSKSEFWLALHVLLTFRRLLPKNGVTLHWDVHS